MKKAYQGTKTLEVLEGANNYNSWIAENILPNTSYPLLEIGCGIGNISKYLINKQQIFLTDIDNYFVKLLKKKYAKKKNVTVQKMDISQKPSEKLKGKFSSIVAINVLEHIEDDLKALKNMNYMLKKGGNIIILVPAKQFAYTRLDKELGHFRRYEKHDLEDKLIMSKFKIEKMYFFNFVGIFSWIIRDKITTNKKHLSKSHIALFDMIVLILKPIEKIIKIPIGISIIVNATKC